MQINKKRWNEKNCNLGTIRITINSGKKHPWMLKLAGKNDMRNVILQSSSLSSHKKINYKAGGKSNFTVTKVKKTLS